MYGIMLTRNYSCSHLDYDDAAVGHVGVGTAEDGRRVRASPAAVCLPIVFMLLLGRLQYVQGLLLVLRRPGLVRMAGVADGGCELSTCVVHFARCRPTD